MKIPYEKGVAIHSAPSFAMHAARCAAKRKQGNRWAGYGASKTPNQDADVIGPAEGHMTRGDSARLGPVLRSRRPQARLDTSCTRTGRPRGCLCRHGQADGRRLRPYGPYARPRGVGQRHSTDETFEQGRKHVGGEGGGKAAEQGEHRLSPTRTRHRAGPACSLGGPMGGSGVAARPLLSELRAV